jgi:uncharacterized protein YceH (UPF0502 family)
VDPDAVEMRVLGCLLEKQRTTPDAYPLTLNSLRLACNQSTNRDPVVDYSERDVRGALERLGKRRWTRLASWGNSRVMKYRHLIDETLSLSEPELSVLAVLMLRGPQTTGELNQRTERLHRFAEGELEETLRRLAEREYARELPRRPGERGTRWLQLLGGDGDGDPHAATAYDVPSGTAPPADDLPHTAPAPVVSSPPPAHAAVAPEAALEAAPDAAFVSPAEPSAPDAGGRAAGTADPDPFRGEVNGRLEHLEQELAALRAELAELREQLGG